MTKQDPKARLDAALSVLHRVKQRILELNQEDELLQEVCRILHEELAYDLVWIAEADNTPTHPKQKDAPRTQASKTLTHRAIYNATDPPIEPSEIVKAVTEKAMNHQRPIVVVTQDDGRVCSAVSVTLDEGEHLLLGVSTVSPQNGDSGIPSSACPSHLSEDLPLLSALAGDLSLAIGSLRMEERRERAEEALRISEERFRRLAEHALTGIVLIQNDLYRYVNRAFAKMFGYNTPTEIIDKLGPLDLAAPESYDLVKENIEKRILGQIRAARYRYVGLRRDGTRFDVEEYGARTIHAQRLGIVATVLDVTAQEASRRRLEALSQAGLALSRAQTLQGALDEAVIQVLRIVPCDTACIILLNDGRLRRAAIAGPLNLAGSVYAEVPEGARLVDVPLLNKIAETSEALIIDDPFKGLETSDADGETPFHRQQRRRGMKAAEASSDALETLLQDGAGIGTAVRAYAGIPLIVRGQVLGFINLESVQPKQFSDEDAQHLRLFADYVAATLQHLRLVASLEEERNRLQTINELSHTLAETLELQEVASRALRHICRAVHADQSLLFLWAPQLSVMVALASEGFKDETVSQLSLKLAPGEAGPLQAAVEQRRPQVSEDLTVESAWYPVEMIGTDIACSLNVPLEAHGELVGMLTFFSKEPSAFDDAHADLASALSVPVALAIQNARFYEEAAQQAEVLAESLRRQEELDRMKDELIQNISHELRTPLSLVMGYAELLQSGQLGPIPSQQISAVDVITRRTRMLRSLVEDIALLWNLERQHNSREPLDLTELVATTALEFQSQAEERQLTLEASTPSEQAMIRGVPVQIRRVLDNLIGNALKFTPPGGRIDVDLMMDDQSATLKVTDTGIGVPEEKLQRIFERFYQVDGSMRRKYGGTGLGLALVKAIVEAHKGTIGAESPIYDDRDRPGTCVTIRLPLDDELAVYRERWMSPSRDQ